MVHVLIAQLYNLARDSAKTGIQDVDKHSGGSAVQPGADGVTKRISESCCHCCLRSYAELGPAKPTLKP